MESIHVLARTYKLLYLYFYRKYISVLNNRLTYKCSFYHSLMSKICLLDLYQIKYKHLLKQLRNFYKVKKLPLFI